MNLYVSNLGEDVTSESLRAIFATHGEVSAYSVVRQQAAGPLKGFGLIHMPNEAEARKAMEKINGMVVNGCLIAVSETKPAHNENSRVAGEGRRR